MSAPNTKYVQVTHPVPRDPAEYSPTTHFLQRKKYRSDPEVKSWIIDECIELGELSGASDIEATTPDSVDGCQRFTFDREIWSEGLHEWRIVVAIVPRAFINHDTTHFVLTAYCGCHDEDAEDCQR